MVKPRSHRTCEQTPPGCQLGGSSVRAGKPQTASASASTGLPTQGGNDTTRGALHDRCRPGGVFRRSGLQLLVAEIDAVRSHPCPIARRAAARTSQSCLRTSGHRRPLRRPGCAWQCDPRTIDRGSPRRRNRQNSGWLLPAPAACRHPGHSSVRPTAARYSRDAAALPGERDCVRRPIRSPTFFS